MADVNTTPDQNQVKQEAQVLEGLARQFLTGNNEDATFKRFTDEITSTQSHGMDFTKAVFDQIRKDNSGVNFLPHVELSETSNGGLQLDITPPFLEGMVGVNYRSIDAGVSPNSVFTAATAGRNFIVGQRELEHFQHFHTK